MAGVMATFGVGLGWACPALGGPTFLGRRSRRGLEGRCRGGGSGLWTVMLVTVRWALVLGPESPSRVPCGESLVGGLGLAAPVPDRLGCAELQFWTPVVTL